MTVARPLDDLLSQSDIQGKKVFVRADLNVPVTPQGTIREATRLDRLLPTLQELSDAGARVGILSHFGRPNGEKNPAMSLKPIAQALSSILNKDVSFCADCIGHPAMTGMDNLPAGGLTVLENTRFHPGEEANDEAFIKSLSAPADAFVNDAFSAAHRAHASTEGMARILPSYAGRSLQKDPDIRSIGPNMDHKDLKGRSWSDQVTAFIIQMYSNVGKTVVSINKNFKKFITFKKVGA